MDLKKVASVIISLLIIISAFFAVPINAMAYNDPTGTGGDTANIPEGFTPIYNKVELYTYLHDNTRTDNFILMDDITFSSSDFAPGGGWEPVQHFAGRIFDGGNHIIKGLPIRGSEGGVAMFAMLSDSTVRNLGLVDVVVTADGEYSAMVAPIAGHMVHSAIDYCYTKTKINVNSGSNISVGGLAAVAVNSEISNSFSACSINVDSLDGLVGGLLGRDTDTHVLNSYALVNISCNGPSMIGGLVGMTNGQTAASGMEKSYVIGNIRSARTEANVGGIVGFAECDMPDPTFFDEFFQYCYYDIENADLLPSANFMTAVGNRKIDIFDYDEKGISDFAGLDFEYLWTYNDLPMIKWLPTIYYAYVPSTPGGSITTDYPAYHKGDTITVSVENDPGYQLVAGSLNYAYTVDGDTAVYKNIINQPSGTKKGMGQGTSFSFKSPGSVVISGAFNSTERTSFSFATIGTSVRKSGNTFDGIRFLTRIYLPKRPEDGVLTLDVKYANEDWTITDFGTMLLPSEFIPANSELTLETPLIQKASALANGSIYDLSANYVDFTVFIVGIAPKRHAREYVARAYVELKNVAGETMYLYSEPTSRSVDETMLMQHKQVEYEDYYQYSFLTEKEREAYRRIAYAAMILQTEVVLDDIEITLESVDKAFKALRCDRPELFWLCRNYLYSYYNNSGQIDIVSLYIFFTDGVKYDAYDFTNGQFKFDANRQTIYNQREEFKTAVNDILLNVPYYETTVEKERLAHNAITDLMTYDSASAASSWTGDTHAYTAYGGAVQHLGVCEAYGRLTQWMMYRIGINATCITGWGNGDNHLWNAVEIDGTWYLLDTTWDDQPSLPDGRIYYYFNASETTFSWDHSPAADVLMVPSCYDESLSWFNNNVMKVYSMDVSPSSLGLQDYVEKFIATGDNTFYFTAPVGFLVHDYISNNYNDFRFTLANYGYNFQGGYMTLQRNDIYIIYLTRA